MSNISVRRVNIPGADSNKKRKGTKDLGIELGRSTSSEDSAARDRLITARVTLLMKNPFFGNLATRLTLKNADEWLTTAATDGRYFYYNAKFVNSLDNQELVFLFGHEVLHVVYDHMGRREDRNPKLSNIAADFAVNRDLVKHRIGRMITKVDVLYDEKYNADGWTYEKIYADLEENCDEMTMEEYLDLLLDEHIKNAPGENMSEEERQRIRDEFREAVLSAAKTETDAGKLPEGIRKMIEELTEPKMDWREMLPQTLQSVFKSDYTWMKSSRRAWHMDAVLPGSDREKEVDVVIAMDASGSCVDMLKDFLAEVKGIMEQFHAYRIHLMTFDTEVYNPQVFTPDNMDSLMEYEIMGGGGTLFMPVYNYLQENDIVPEKLVWLTDMCPCDDKWKNEADYCDTLWIIHSTKITPPFGQYAFYEEA